MRMCSIFGGSNSNEYNNEEGIDTAPTQELASRSIPEPLQSLDGSDIDTNVNDDDDHDGSGLRNDLPHFPTPSSTRSLSSGECDSDTSYVHKKRKPRKHINLDTQHLESRHTIQQHKNLLKSIETEFNADLTGHIWSTVLIKQKEREREERRRRRGLFECSANDSHDEEVRPPPSKRRRGRPKLSGPDHTSDKIITRVWTSWPLPYGQLPPISPSTTVVSATSNTSEPHPLEEAITALFLRQATQTLRAKNLPVSSDDTVSNHMLQPIIGGILSRLDRLLLAVHETNNSELRGQLGKDRLYRKVPMGWSGVLGLAGLSGWDEGWGGDGAIAENQTSDTITSMATLGPVGRATQRMCAATGEQMNWRTWPVSSGSMTISSPFTFPIQHPSKTTMTSSVDQSTPAPSHTPNDTRLLYHGTSSFDLYSGVHRDGFLELIPTSVEQKKRNGQNTALRLEKNLNFNHTARRHDGHLNNATKDGGAQSDNNDEGGEDLEEIIDSNIGISNVGSESGDEDADSDE